MPFYNVTVHRNKILHEEYMATSYKPIICHGRLGHTIEPKDREVNEVAIMKLGLKRNKKYSKTFGDPVTIEDYQTGELVFKL